MMQCLHRSYDFVLELLNLFKSEQMRFVQFPRIRGVLVSSRNSPFFEYEQNVQRREIMIVFLHQLRDFDAVICRHRVPREHLLFAVMLAMYRLQIQPFPNGFVYPELSFVVSLQNVPYYNARPLPALFVLDLIMITN